MQERSSWDWETGTKTVADLNGWKSDYVWVEEPHASPDGEAVAAVVSAVTEESPPCPPRAHCRPR
jgi:hypothetical protein